MMERNRVFVIGLMSIIFLSDYARGILEEENDEYYDYALNEDYFYLDDGSMGDACMLKPCDNGGTCIDIGETDFMCTCVAGYYGKHCEHDRPCLANPCLNNGTCGTINRFSYTCSCEDGFWGDHCQHPQPCMSNLCLNGGICRVINDTSYTCACSVTYQGDVCQYEKPCVNNPCTNGGTCLPDADDGFTCSCREGRTGRHCEETVNCGKAGPALQVQNATINQFRDSPRGWEAEYGRTKTCSCLSGYYSTRGVCRARCRSDGSWRVEGKCLPRHCGDPPDIENAEVVRSTGHTYKNTIQYRCYDDHDMKGNDTLICDSTGTWAKLSQWEESWPFCLATPTCPTPPDIPGGHLVSLNTTYEFDYARYECDVDATMMGDGIARCWKIGYKTVYDRRNSIPYRVKQLDWAYVPSCERKCPVPVGKSGNQSAVMVKVTKCLTHSYSRYPDETCEEPIYYHVAKNETKRDRAMVFYGNELCVARKYTKEKYTLSPSLSECRSFCIPGRQGYHRLVVMDSLMYNDNKVTLTRVTYKYQSVGMAIGKE